MRELGRDWGRVGEEAKEGKKRGNKEMEKGGAGERGEVKEGKRRWIREQGRSWKGWEK